MKVLFTSLLLVCLGTNAYAQHPQDKSLKEAIAAAKKGKTTLLMQQKLAYSKVLLEAVMLEKFELIEQSADTLLAISEETSWQETNENFGRYAHSFQNAAKELISSAKKEKSSRVALPYMRLNLSCMECHQYVRDKRKK